MTDERPQPPDLIATGLAGLIDGVRRDIADLRDDVREDNRAVEERMTAQIATVSARQAELHDQIVDFAKGHAELHEDEAIDRRKTHGEFYEYIRRSELADARRDGMLGVARFAIELVSRHAGRLVQVILAAAALLGIATGSIHLAVGG